MSNMTPDDLIAMIASKGLLPPEMIRELRDSVTRTPGISARKIMRWLVKNGHLTRYQAQELLAGRSENAVNKSGPTKGGPDELEVIDELEEISSGGGAQFPPALPPLGAGGGLPSGLESMMQAANMGQALTPGGTLGLPNAPKKKGPINVWESKLILLGGGGLFALVLLAVGLYFLIDRTTAEDALQAAEKEYADGNYATAVAAYDAYLKKFPQHTRVSIARVHRAMSLMRQQVDGAKGQSWMRALDESKTILDSVLQEESLPDARAEISIMLHNIAQGLSEYAEGEINADAVAACRRAIEMARDPQYVPAKNRDEQRLVRCEAQLARVDRDLDRGKQLQVAVDLIGKAVEQGEVARAYEIRKKLLGEYPDMASDPDLQQAILAASAKEQELVKFTPQQRDAETKDVERPMTTILLPDTKLHQAAQGLAGQVVCALAEGAVYALDAGTGKVLWRRFVGPDTVAPPARIGAQAGGDVLLVDSQQGEVVRVAATTGALKWRLPVPGVKLTPVVQGGRLLVVGSEGGRGRLHAVDLETGRSSGFVELPQPIRAPPTVDSDGKLLYLVSEHSNLYVLDAAGFACQMVVYLGHEPGTITASAALAGPYVILAENRQAKVAWVRCLKLEEGTDDDGKPFQSLRPLQEVRVDGHVSNAPVVNGRSLFVGTDLGGVFMFDISPSNPKEPLVKGPLKTASLTKRRNTFLHVRGARLWVANTQFASYDVQLAGGQLQSRWIDDEASEFLQPFQLAGQVIFHVRGQTGKPGVVVTAAQMDEKSKYWETRLAAPPAGGALLDSKRGEVSVLLADGSLFRTPLSELAAKREAAAKDNVTPLASTPSYRVDPPPPLNSQPLALAASRWAFVSPSQTSRVLAYSPGDEKPGNDKDVLRWVPLPDAAGGLPAVLRDKLVVPGAAGIVFEFDPFAARLGAAPFLPNIDAGREFRWQVDADSQQSDVLLFDGRPQRSRFFRVGLQAEPIAHLAALAQTETQQSLSTPIARIAQTALAVNQASDLIAFELPGLRQKWIRKLPGPVVWGPRAVGNRVLLLVEPQPYDEVHLTSGEVLPVQPITVALPQNPRPDERLLVQLLNVPAEALPSAGKSKPGTPVKRPRPGTKSAASTDLAKASPTTSAAKANAKSKEKPLPPGARSLEWREIQDIKRYDDLLAELSLHRLICLEDGVEGPAWSVPWPHGPLAGMPSPLSDGGLLVASASGHVVRIGPRGDQVGQIDLGQPLASGPVLLDVRQLALAGRDGTLHIAAIP